MIPNFRAYDLDESEWINIRTVGFLEGGEFWYLQAWDENENDIDPPYFEDDLGKTWALMQSTGLKDKNGIEIFEGDIISCEIETIEKFIICEQCGCFGIRDKVDGFISLNSINEILSINKEFEIIGNIYEHPHLLEE